MISGNPQGQVTDLVKEIVGQRMPFKTAARLNNRSVIKTEIAVPRDSVVINNGEMISNIPRIGTVNDHEKQENKCFSISRRQNDFQEG